MLNISEGGPNALEGPQTAEAPRLAISPEQLYYHGKHRTDSYLDILERFIPGLSTEARNHLTHSRDYSSRNVARWFESLSDTLWNSNLFYSLFGLSSHETRIPIQEKFNNRLWTANKDGTLNHVVSDDIVGLFRPGDEANWPNLVLTSNHARAWRSKDLSELMHGVERLAHDSWGRALPIGRLTRNTPASEMAGKTIVALACHTERDIFLNGAKLIDRRLDLMEDPNKDVPEKRTLSHISPASVRLAKLILKNMLAPESQALINLNLGLDEQTGNVARPLCAAQDPAYKERGFLLRADAERIAQHIKLVGYSRGANTVTDALRFLYREFALLGDRLQRMGEDGKLRPVSEKDIRTVISNIGLLSLAPGEVPLTKAEREKVGINRTTILNENDLTAGHLVNPDEADYDRWADTLVRIRGSHEEAGHSLSAALGSLNAPGYIMDARSAEKDGQYRQAQDEVKSFFASNFMKQAVTALCPAHNPQTNENELYLQFAPGISRADESVLRDDLLRALRDNGFLQARAYSDLTHRRRIQIILGEGGVPIERDAAMLGQCKKALDAWQNKEGSSLFITHEALHALTPQTPTMYIDAASATRAGQERGNQRGA